MSKMIRYAAVFMGLLFTSLVSAQTYAPMVPVRFLDTRLGYTTVDGQFAGTGPMASGTTLNFTVLGRAGVPTSGVSAVALNITVTNSTGAGYLTAWPAGTAQPNASNLNFVPGLAISNQVIAKVVNNQVSIYVYASGGTANVIVDVAGYFPATSDLTPLTPARLLDTRAGMSTVDGRYAGGGAVQAGSTLTLPVLGRGGILPSGVSAVVVNVTATNPTAATYVTVWPSGTARPNASNLNLVAGQTIPNLVIVAPGTGSGGAILLYNSAGSTDLIVDVVGYFSTTTTLTPLVPARLLDTRSGTATIDGQFVGQQPVGTGTTFRLPVLGRGGVPISGVGAVALNVTAVTPSASGYVTAWGSDTTLNDAPPQAMDLNFKAGDVIPSLVIAQVGANGQVSLYNSNGSTHLVADVVGWFPKTGPAAQYGFFDQGFTNTVDVVASDYYGAVGTSISPLRANQCVFSAVNPNAARCGVAGSYVFSQTNYYSRNWPGNCAFGNSSLSGPCANNWVIIHNVDTNFSNPASNGWELYQGTGSSRGNSGPPDQSLPLSVPYQGLMGYQLTTSYDNINRPTIAIDFSYQNSQGYAGAAPYVAFGALDRGGGYGNGHPIGALNPTTGIPHILSFVARLWDATPPQVDAQWGAAQLTSEVLILAKWGTVPKGVRVYLSHYDNRYPGPANPGFLTSNGAANWSWPFPDSAWYPGAKFSAIVVENIAATCRDDTIVTATSNSPTPVISLNDYPNNDVAYTIDVQKLFACANNKGQFSNAYPEPMPTTQNIPITGVLWGLEGVGTGRGGINFDAHSMRMDPQ